MAQQGWTLDLTRCTGCHTCEIACKAENNTFPQQSPLELESVFEAETVNWRRVLEVESGSFPRPKRAFYSMSCHHCAHPACLESCPVDAISKRDSDGIVLIDQEQCVGCRYCEAVCPYGAPQFNGRTGKVEKCTACVHRQDVGLEPACVTACLGRALSWGSYSGSNGAVPSEFADPSLTGPSITWLRDKVHE